MRATAGQDLADRSFFNMAWALWRRAENESSGPFPRNPLQCSIINSSAALISLNSLSLSIMLWLATTVPSLVDKSLPIMRLAAGKKVASDGRVLGNPPSFSPQIERPRYLEPGRWFRSATIGVE
jgi:hypothetical protein